MSDWWQGFFCGWLTVVVVSAGILAFLMLMAPECDEDERPLN